MTNSSFQKIFNTPKPIIGAIHLMALPGAPLYEGNMTKVYEQALKETGIFQKNGVDAIIVENFRDKPFFPERIPAETIAALTAVGREIKKSVSIPVGVNALRNDGESAMAIATAIEADFIRVNVHMGTVVSEQGLIQGLSHKTLRLRKHLKSNVLIFADVGVKHAAVLADRGLATETKDLAERGLADAIIVSGPLTGEETSLEDIQIVRKNTNLPIIIGSGATPDNIDKMYDQIDGLIVGSYFKKDGKGRNFVEEERVKRFTQKMNQLR